MKLRFTICEMILFVAAAAIALGWWIDRSRLSEKLVDVRIDEFEAQSFTRPNMRKGGQ